MSTRLFSNATPHLCFFKNSKIGNKTSKMLVWLGGADRFFPNFEKTKAATKAVRCFHFICLIETRTGEIFFYPNGYGEMPRTSYHKDLSQEAPFWPSLSPEQRTTESHLPLSYIRSSPVSESISSESQGSPCASNSDDSPDAISVSRTEQQGKKFFEKWSKKEKKLLVQL